MEQLLLVVVPAKHLTCTCFKCQAHNAPYKVEYLFGNLILMNAVCATCHTAYYVYWDLLKVQMEQDEKEVEYMRAAMKLLEGKQDAA